MSKLFIERDDDTIGWSAKNQLAAEFMLMMFGIASLHIMTMRGWSILRHAKCQVALLALKTPV